MYTDLRHIETYNWITISLLLCVMILSISRWFSTFYISELISSYFKDNFIKLSRSSEYQFSLLIASSLVIYSINLSLFTYLFYQNQQDRSIEPNGYLLTLTGVTIFLLSKHYVGKLIAALCNFDKVLFLIDHHRNIYRAMFSYALLIVNVLIVYIFKFNQYYLHASAFFLIVVLLYYHLRIIYTYRAILIPANLYFILYLCALEIAPYLLLYKYFML